MPEGGGRAPTRGRAKRPLRVLHLFSNHKVTGPAETALDAARAVGSLRGVEAEFAAGQGPGGESGLRRLAVERGARVGDLGLELGKHFAPLGLLRDVRRLRERLRADPPDVIHCHLPGDHLLAALSAPPEIPIVRSLYDSAPPRRGWRSIWTLRRRSERIVCFSRALEEALAGPPYRIGRERLLRLEPPIDLARFDPRRPRAGRRPLPSAPPGDFAVGIAARLQTHRRFEALFQAAALARRRIPGLRLWVLGRGTHSREVAREPVARLGLEGTVLLPGFLEGEEYVEALAALEAVVFLVPGSDGTCRAVREALAMGLPVVASRRGMLPELVRDGETGLLVDETPEALAEALGALAGDPARRRRMASAARADALARFSYQDHAAALAALYREVVSGDRRGGAARPGPRRAEAPPGGRTSPERFVSTTGPLGRVLHRADLVPAELWRGLAGAGGGAEGLRLLKRDRKASVHSGLAFGGRPVCLKIYPGSRRGRRGFRNLSLLWRLGVPVPEPYFLWERPRRLGGGAVVGMEDLAPRSELDRWLSGRLRAAPSSAGERAAPLLRPLFRALGAAVRDLHARGLYLDDLKTCNIFLEEGERPRFRFVDLDGVESGRAVSLRRRARNLVQLNRSTPLAAGLAARWAFWSEYRRGLPPREARRLRRDVLALSAVRPVVYVSREGVREEPWPARVGDWPR